MTIICVCETTIIIFVLEHHLFSTMVARICAVSIFLAVSDISLSESLVTTFSCSAKKNDKLEVMRD